MRLIVFIRLRGNRRKQRDQPAKRRSINSISHGARSAAAVQIVHNAIHSAAWEAEMFTYDRTAVCYAIKYQGPGVEPREKLCDARVLRTHGYVCVSPI